MIATPAVRRYCIAVNPGVQPLSDLTFSLVGPGRVGTSLAHWLTATGAVFSQVTGRSLERPAQLVEKLGGRVVELSDLVTDGEDLLLVAVTDPALEEVTDALVGRAQAAVVLHTSGSQASRVLEPLASQGSAIG